MNFGLSGFEDGTDTSRIVELSNNVLKEFYIIHNITDDIHYPIKKDDFIKNVMPIMINGKAKAEFAYVCFDKYINFYGIQFVK